jgi:hypothetical protein
MSKLIDSGGYGCIYYPKIDCSGNVHVEDKMVSKLINFDDAEHELYMAKKIKKIKNYNQYFIPAENSCTLNKNVKFKPCSAIKPHHNKFKILYIPYKETLPLKLSFQILYHSLLESVHLLVAHKIVHFDLKETNIIHSDRIYIIDFGISINMNNVYSKVQKYFYTYYIQYYAWPLEVHLLNYRVNVGNITPDILSTICHDFVKYNIILKSSKPEFIKEYISGSIEYYTPIITLSYNEFIKKCIHSWKTWDNYALIIYLFKLNYTIPNLFFKNIHYLPSQRLSVTKCLQLTAASTA